MLLQRYLVQLRLKKKLIINYFKLPKLDDFLLMSIIPVDEQGNLKPPRDFLVEDAVQTNVSDNWVYSDGSPAETAWRRSSEYPYVLQILAATIKSAMYGTLMFDTNMYEKNAQYDQILQKNKSYRPGIADYQIHGQSDGSGGILRVEGYNQFISEFTRFGGYSVDDAITKINNLELNRGTIIKYKFSILSIINICNNSRWKS